MEEKSQAGRTYPIIISSLACMHEPSKRTRKKMRRREKLKEFANKVLCVGLHGHAKSKVFKWWLMTRCMHAERFKHYGDEAKKKAKQFGSDEGLKRGGITTFASKYFFPYATGFYWLFILLCLLFIWLGFFYPYPEAIINCFFFDSIHA